MTNREKAKQYLQENTSELLQACRDANGYNGQFDFCDYYEDIEEVCDFMSGYELARAIIYGDVTNVIEPVRFNAYGNLENVTEYDLEQEALDYIDELLDFIEEYPEEISNSELVEILEGEEDE